MAAHRPAGLGSPFVPQTDSDTQDAAPWGAVGDDTTADAPKELQEAAASVNARGEDDLLRKPLSFRKRRLPRPGFLSPHSLDFFSAGAAAGGSSDSSLSPQTFANNGVSSTPAGQAFHSTALTSPVSPMTLPSGQGAAHGFFAEAGAASQVSSPQPTSSLLAAAISAHDAERDARRATAAATATLPGCSCAYTPAASPALAATCSGGSILRKASDSVTRAQERKGSR